MEINFGVRLTSTLVILLIVSHIESRQNNLARWSLLCHSDKHVYRVVRTPYGLRCLSTKRFAEKRSASDLSPLESQLTEYDGPKSLPFMIDQTVNLVGPNLKSVAPSRYKKVMIKNNRGPWKIANQIFKRSPHRRRPPLGLSYAFLEEEMAEYELPSSANEVQKLKTTIRPANNDGLLVSKQIVQESVLKVPKLVIGSWMKLPEFVDESVIAKYGGILRHESSTKIPRRIAAAIERNANNLLRRSWTNADSGVSDLMHDDSVINVKLKRNILEANRNVSHYPFGDDSDDTDEDSFATERTRPESANTRRPKITPIKIFVFLNPNRTVKIDSMSRNIDIDSRQFLPLNETVSGRTTAESLTSVTSVPFEWSTQTTGQSTTPTVSAFASKLIKLSKLALDQRPKSAQMVASVNDSKVESKPIDEDYIDYLVPERVGEVSTPSPAPISRHWNFVCGDRRGFFADTDNQCRTYYQCSVRGRQRFECPPNTKFNQYSLICDWSDNVSCDETVKDEHIKTTSLVAVTTTPITGTAADEESAEYEDDSDETRK